MTVLRSGAGGSKKSGCAPGGGRAIAGFTASRSCASHPTEALRRERALTIPRLRGSGSPDPYAVRLHDIDSEGYADLLTPNPDHMAVLVAEADGQPCRCASARSRSSRGLWWATAKAVARVVLLDPPFRQCAPKPGHSICSRHYQQWILTWPVESNTVLGSESQGVQE